MSEKILKIYSRESYEFSSRFIRTVFLMDPAALELERDVAGETSGTTQEATQESSEKISGFGLGN